MVWKSMRFSYMRALRNKNTQTHVWLPAYKCVHGYNRKTCTHIRNACNYKWNYTKFIRHRGGNLPPLLNDGSLNTNDCAHFKTYGCVCSIEIFNKGVLPKCLRTYPWRRLWWRRRAQRRVFLSSGLNQTLVSTYLENETSIFSKSAYWIGKQKHDSTRDTSYH